MSEASRENPDSTMRIPPLTTAPISRLTLALFAGASSDHNPIHVDLDYARRSGMEDVFAHGMLLMAYLGRSLTNWVPQSELRRFTVRFVAITHVHESISCTGRVVEEFSQNGERLARLELSAQNEKGEIKAMGEALIAVS
ncbi:MAG: MaoC family dehydratase [Candidatus Acidiferrales bacterium]